MLVVSEFNFDAYDIWKQYCAKVGWESPWTDRIPFELKKGKVYRDWYLAQRDKFIKICWWLYENKEYEVLKELHLRQCEGANGQCSFFCANYGQKNCSAKGFGVDEIFPGMLEIFSKYMEEKKK